MFLIFRFNPFIFRDLNKNSKGKRFANPPNTRQENKQTAKGTSEHDRLPVGLIAQLVKHCTGIAEVMCSNPVQA